MIAARCFPHAGGTETHVHEVGTRMVAAGHDVTVLTSDPTGRLPADEIVGGVRVRRLKSWPAGRDYHFCPGLVPAIWRGGWDVAHVQGYHTLFAPLAMLALLARRVPFAVTFHSGGHSSGLRKFFRNAQHAMLAPLLRRASRLIGVSEFEADFFSRRIGVARTQFAVVPNGGRLPTPSARPEPKADAPLIVSLGRLEKYKGHHLAVAGFAKLIETVPKARLRILGEGPYEGALRALVAKLNLGDAVQIGAIPPAQRHIMADLLASSSLVVLLSEYEAHPVAVMEALSLELRVLTSDTSGFRELAERGLVGAIPLGSDPGEIAAAMTRELNATRPITGVSLPDWQDCTDRLLSIYREFVRAPAAHGVMAGSDSAVQSVLHDQTS